MPKPQYSQKFREAWLKDPLLKDWLIAVESTTGKTAKCKFCQTILTSRYADLKNHADSKKHKSNSKIILGKSQPKINFPKTAIIHEAKIAEAKLALFVANHMAISSTDHLVPLCKDIFKGDAATHLEMHRTKCGGIIKNIMAPYFVNQLSKDIGDNFYSLILDESTDISTTKYLGCTIIYFSPSLNKIVNSFLSLVQLERGDAESILNAIYDLLKTFNLKLCNLRGIGTDNASVMTGVNNGLYVKLKEKVPNLILIKCICHSLQLAVSAAAKECLPRNLEYLIRETYTWFSHSSMRQEAYKKLYNLINEGADPLKIVQSCTTRWLSIEVAVTRIFEQWLELKTHFNVAKESESCFTAQILNDIYNDDYTYAYICFLKPLLTEIQQVNKAFESNNADPTKLLQDLMLLLNSLIQKVTLPNSNFKVFDDNIEHFLNRNCHLGYLFETKTTEMKQRGCDENKVNTIRNRCIDFLMKLIKEITNRIPDNVHILEKISFFSVENTLRAVKEDILPLLKYCNYSPQKIDTIQNQWNNINLIKWEKNENTQKFWYEVFNYRDSNGENPFYELATCALSFLILPNSNAEVERLFSQMNIVKSKLRNKMQLSMLNAILTIKSAMSRYEVCCYNYQISPEIYSKIKTKAAYETPDLGLDADFDIF